MEITDIETIPLSCPVPEEHQWHIGGSKMPPQKGVKADMLILRVHTDEEITGLGEPCPYGGIDELVTATETLKPSLVGTDPFDVEVITDPDRHGVIAGTEESGTTQDRWRESRAENYVLAAVNMACWDIMGKVTGRPVCKLLGGQLRDEIDVYASGGIDWRFLDRPEILADEAERYLDRGHSAFKIRIANDERFFTALESVRDRVGDRLELLIEGNMRFRNPPEAVRFGRRLREFDPYWFEEPLELGDVDGYAELRSRLPDIPIAGGESHTGVEQFEPWIDRRAYDIVQPDCNVMGISEVKRVAELASRNGMLCCPHNWHNAVTTAASVQVLASIPNADRMEMQQTWYWSCPAFRDDIINESFEVTDGRVAVPDRPGLGITLDEAALDEYPYEEGPCQVRWDDHPFSGSS